MCLDCMHPPCSNPKCETCKSCRNPKCNKGVNCNNEPEPLVGAALSMLKKTKLCSACRTADSIECDECKEQRASRKLVADDDNDERFKEERFLTSPAVFPTNDSNYDVNTKRSLHFAASQDKGIMYCIAQDKPSLQALRERPDIPDRKLEFLNRHDRESGDLYGILPLIKGMPVAMTDHIDRSIDKRILRGRVGYVHFLGYR